jgi:hypothetical protein
VTEQYGLLKVNAETYSRFERESGKLRSEQIEAEESGAEVTRVWLAEVSSANEVSWREDGFGSAFSAFGLSRNEGDAEGGYKKRDVLG